ncbi:membrane anchor subunit of succinate dehydrogenase, Sdh4, partial [Nowakowskiella sp. JEL0078]
AAAAEKALEHKSKTHGSYHWNIERGLSVISLPLIASAALVGQNSLIDLGLAVVIPLHCHFGLEGLVVDYLPYRTYPVIYRAGKILVYTLTGLTIYGLYEFNTNDIGITEFTKRIWTGKVKA